jgi:hypothetical protein
MAMIPRPNNKKDKDSWPLRHGSFSFVKKMWR